MPDNCTDTCALAPRVEALEEANRQHRKAHEGMYDRIRALEKSDAVQDANYITIIENLDVLTAKVETLEAKPAKRWDGLVDKLIYLVAGAVVAWIAAGAPGLN